MARFLYIEDYDDLRMKVVTNLRKTFPGDEFMTAVDYKSAVAAVNRDGPFAGIISDWHYPGTPTATAMNTQCGGSDFLRYLQDQKILTPVAIVTLHMDEDMSVIEEMKKKGLSLTDCSVHIKRIESFHAIIKSFKQAIEARATAAGAPAEAKA
ncbi:MAG: hypothetical protein M3N08_02255 [Pseudomonadota bacterium]|nr:hypothetical protein [Pseudomonadota bacterium]